MTPLGIIAGAGALPAALAAAARAEGRTLAVAALRGFANAAALRECAHQFAELPLGEFQTTFEFLHKAGCRELVLAGKVPKHWLWQKPQLLQPDKFAREILAAAKNRNDDSLLGACAALLERQGFQLLPQLQIAPKLCTPEGALGAHKADAAQMQDAAFGWRIAKALGAADAGQTAVVQNRAVLALEAVEGTDAAIIRGGALAAAAPAPAATVVKVAKPRQDPRFDVPTAGPQTIRAMAAAGCGMLALEAGASITLERARLVACADAAGIAVAGVTAPEPGE